MHISEKLKEYLADSKIVCASNIIVTDLENIQLVELSNNNVPKITPNDKLSNDILDLIKKWNSYDIDKSDLFCVMNYYCLNLIKNDTNNYSAQMIYPLFNKDNKLLGLIIFFRTNKDYILSSTKPISTAVKFTNEFLNEEN
mgnify:CR=1 FL=1